MKHQTTPWGATVQQKGGDEEGDEGDEGGGASTQPPVVLEGRWKNQGKGFHQQATEAHHHQNHHHQRTHLQIYVSDTQVDHHSGEGEEYTIHGPGSRILDLGFQIA